MLQTRIETQTPKIAMQIEITNKRNQNGVKDSCNMYRTIGGEHFIQWTSNFNQDTVKGYRAAGIKVRVIQDELFIRHADVQKALALPESL